MKRIKYFVLLFSLCSICNAQDIVLSVVMPNSSENLKNSHYSKLEAKTTQIVTNAGLSGIGFNHDFVIYPKFDIYEDEVIESGLKNQTMIKAEISLYILQTSNKMTLSSVSKGITGIGKTKDIAITNAISSISVTDNDFSEFMETGKKRIITYYQNNCDAILKQADALTKVQQYEQALTLLISVPKEATTCHSKTSAQLSSIYKDYQNYHCATLLQQAKTKFAAMEYTEALEIVSMIDPTSKCNEETKAFIKSTESKVEKTDKKDWDLMLKRWDDNMEMEKLRMNNIKEITNSYYQSQQNHLEDFDFKMIVR